MVVTHGSGPQLRTSVLESIADIWTGHLPLQANATISPRPGTLVTQEGLKDRA